MLMRSTWILKPETTATLPRSYRLELSKRLHTQAGIELGSETIPSTTFSGLLGKAQAAEGFITFSPDEFYRLSLSGLQESASKAIATLNLTDTFDFLGTEFQVIDREDETTSYEALYHQYVANEPEPERQMVLSFLSPTAFSQNRTYLPLPVPTLLFRSWLERWNHFSSVYLGGDELIRYLGEAVALSRHRIQTQSFPIYKGNVSGFVGTATLSILYRSDPLLAQVANLLVHYGQFAGSGMKTRLGMGKTNLQIPEMVQRTVS
ncbi:CRISPR system precrRNA processing endoribonuclease RAMP protein Cas6 [Leptolyngbyaceae cyanobacterium CCMR0082]|uniref:CRISPR system precrRNA processing endoribonuclease RAMP protein Cas6 n=1 Tax=Adonisia turfae CCMR0082 TaxID=2304604 RepID=A0A6M0SGX3_9CYAN|nr:CRISPR system precrRNA processing endoribonuclease RAMP protein Cas6 [Adonisia turfae]NEZ67830.1 CRISPR system precrRNA processing endoribonuclease RAMP protein Cas6 [Adonisia turfae CCMR0082]